MHRSKLKALLNQYHPHSPKEIEEKQRMLSFLNHHEDCFERSCLTGHFTGSAWLLDKAGTHALLLHHRKLDSWFQLGGHCDGDPDVLAVAIKEAQEESGIMGIQPVSETIFDVDIHEIPEYKGIPAHNHYDIRFLLQVSSDETFIRNEESNDLQWFDKDISQSPTQEESVLRLFRKWATM